MGAPELCPLCGDAYDVEQAGAQDAIAPGMRAYTCRHRSHGADGFT